MNMDSKQSLKSGQLSIRGGRLQDEKNPHITLKQWRAFHAVVNAGGFLGASESLHLSQSTVSYMLSKLQEQLGIRLMRMEGRKAELTDDGKILLDRSRNLLRDAAELELFADVLRHGQEHEVRIAMHRDFPTSHLTRSLERLLQRGKPICVALSELSERRTAEALQGRRADLAITATRPVGFQAVPLLQIDYVVVMHAQQELARSKHPLSTSALQNEVEVVVS